MGEPPLLHTPVRQLHTASEQNAGFVPEVSLEIKFLLFNIVPSRACDLPPSRFLNFLNCLKLKPWVRLCSTVQVQHYKGVVTV